MYKTSEDLEKNTTLQDHIVLYSDHRNYLGRQARWV